MDRVALLDNRFLFPGGGRPAAGCFRETEKNPGNHHANRVVEIQPPSELFWRNTDVVGYFYHYHPITRQPVIYHQPAYNYIVACFCFGHTPA